MALTLRETYEDLYRKAWIKQNKIDCKRNPLVLNEDRRQKPLQETHELAKQNGMLGGRPKGVRTSKLTEPAKVVNRLIKRGLTMREIGSIVGKSHQSVSEMKRRYDLPREDVE